MSWKVFKSISAVVPLLHLGMYDEVQHVDWWGLLTLEVWCMILALSIIVFLQFCADITAVYYQEFRRFDYGDRSFSWTNVGSSQRWGLNGEVRTGVIGVFSIGQRRFWGLLIEGFGFGSQFVTRLFLCFYLRFC